MKIQKMSRGGESLESEQCATKEGINIISLVEKLYSLINEMSEAINLFSRTISDLNEKNQVITE